MPTVVVDRETQQRSLLAAIADAEATDARLFAERMRLRAELDQSCNTGTEPGPEQFGVLELAGTARIGQLRAGSQFSDARRPRELFPTTWELLAAGVMFRETAVLLLALTVNCAEPVQVEVGARVLARIATANTAEVRTLVTTTILEVEADLDPELTRERLERAKRDRRVWVNAMPDGMNHIGAALDNVATRRWVLDFDELVRAQKIADQRDGIVRTTDQRRADLFAALPSQLLALIQAIQHGDLEQLLALAQQDPELADGLEALADTAPTFAPTDPPTGDPTDPPTGDDDAAADEPVTAPADDAPAADEPADEDQDAAEGEEVLPAAQWRAQHEPPQHEPPRDPPPQDGFGEDPTSTRSEPAGTQEQPDPLLALTVGQLTVAQLTVGLLRLPVRNPVVLYVHIPMTTVLDLDNRAGFIEGLGPVPAEQSRLLVPVAGLRRLYVDPDSGVPIGIDPVVRPPLDQGGELTGARVRDRLLSLLGPSTVRHRAEPQHDPSPALRRFVEVRDQRCLGIGCSCPATRSHTDHELRHPDGPTAAWNLSSKSARCHRAKHAGWAVTRQHDGTAGWTSPLGHAYSKPGVWQAPPPLPADLTLPAPRLAAFDDQGPVTASGTDALWEEPASVPEPVTPPPHRNWDDDPPF